MSFTEMIAWYVGIAGGIALAWFLIRWLTAYRFIMALIFLAGLVISSLASFLLAWPLSRYLGNSDGWLNYSFVVGALVWSVFICVSWRRGNL